jgi:membrane protein
MAALAAAAAWRRSQPPSPTPEKVQPGLSEQQVMDPEAFDALEPGRGRAARAPHQIPIRGWKDVLWRTYLEVTRDRLNAVAGSVTFYTLLAIFPALGVFVSLYGIVADVSLVESQLNDLAGVIPQDVLSLVGEQMLRLATQRPANLSAAFMISLLLSVWSANAGMKALFDGLNIAYDEVEKRNYFLRSALTYVFTFAALCFLIVVTAILVAAPIWFRAVGLEEAGLWWIPLRWLVLAMVAAAAFSFVYRFGPSRTRAQWRWVTVGGASAAVLWLGGSLVYSWYVNTVANFDVTYGSLGAVIGFMLWMYVSVMVVLIGAEFNAEIEHQTAVDSTIGPPAPMGERGAAMADTVGLPLKGNLLDAIGWAWLFGRRQASRVGEMLKRRDPRRVMARR